jgi:hypothetical protein
MECAWRILRVCEILLKKICQLYDQVLEPCELTEDDAKRSSLAGFEG